MPQLEIRRLDPSQAEDYRAIRLLALATDPDAFGSTHEIEAARPLSAFAERLAGSIVLGAYRDGRIIGVAGLMQQGGLKDQHKGFIWGVFVAADARGQGAASQLIAAIIEAAHGLVEQLTLSVVTTNEPALALYRKFGFETYGIEPRALKTEAGYFDEALMVLMLEPS